LQARSLREALMTVTQSTASHGFKLLREQNLAEIKYLSIF
jgi:hypothetical protein